MKKATPRMGWLISEQDSRSLNLYNTYVLVFADLVRSLRWDCDQVFQGITE